MSHPNRLRATEEGNTPWPIVTMRRSGKQTAKMVESNLASLTKLELIKNASFCMKSAENTVALSAALAKNTVLKTVVLRECEINDAGVEAIAAALEQNESVEELDLQQNNITTNGVIALSKGLAKNRGVRTLNLLGQTQKVIGDDAVEALIAMFEQNTTLVKIIWKVNSRRSWEVSKLITRNVSIQKAKASGTDAAHLLPKAKPAEAAEPQGQYVQISSLKGKISSLKGKISSLFDLHLSTSSLKGKISSLKGNWGTTDEKEKGEALSRENASASASANAPQRRECEDAAWIFAIGGLDGPSSMSVGQTVDDVMVDTSADEHFGDKQLNLKTKDDDETSVRFHAAKATRPILSANSIHVAGAAAQAPPAGSTGSPSTARGPRGGRSRLGPTRAFGLICPRATGMSNVGARIGADGPNVNGAATAVPEQYIATQVDQPAELRRRRGLRGRDIEGIPVAPINRDHIFRKTRRDERARPVANAIDSLRSCTVSIWRDANRGVDSFALTRARSCGTWGSERRDKQLLLAIKSKLPCDAKAPNASLSVMDRPAADFNAPRRAMIPRPAGAAPEDEQPGPPAAEARFDVPREVGPESAEAATSGDEAAGDVGGAPGPAARPGEANKKRKIGVVGVGSVSVANVMGCSVDAELCAPREIDPNFELLGEAQCDDDDDGDDGERLDPDAAREGIKREAKFAGPLGAGEVAGRPRDGKARGTRRSGFVSKQLWDARAGDFLACAPRAEAARLLAAAPLLMRVVATTDSGAAFARAHEGRRRDLGGNAAHARRGTWARAEVEEVSLSSVRQRPATMTFLRAYDCLIEMDIRVAVHADDPHASGPTQGVLDEFFDKLVKYLAIMGRSDLAQPGAEEPLNSEELLLRGSGARCARGKISAVGCASCRRGDFEAPYIRYLEGAVDPAMAHRPAQHWRRLRGGADSDWAGCRGARKSTACGIARRCGAAISARAREVSALAQSSPDAACLTVVELAAKMLQVKELMKWLWLQQLIGAGQIMIAKAQGRIICPTCRAMPGLVSLDTLGAGIAAA
ncbi:unnamed protein product [Prorocentrum cordatum]|uniref:Uncharacterized protein n=1 Tax=Prorocentrum cordatum TaxID=2364126 RepID=A0ABN9PEX8_9DINO|nr:unnamed protein product [Polarella glacialis]